MLVCVELTIETDRQMAVYDIDSIDKKEALDAAIDRAKQKASIAGYEWKYYQSGRYGEFEQNEDTSSGLWLLIDPEEYNAENYESEEDAIEAAWDDDATRIFARIITPGEFYDYD